MVARTDLDRRRLGAWVGYGFYFSKSPNSWRGPFGEDALTFVPQLELTPI